MCLMLQRQLDTIINGPFLRELVVPSMSLAPLLRIFDWPQQRSIFGDLVLGDVSHNVLGMELMRCYQADNRNLVRFRPGLNAKVRRRVSGCRSNITRNQTGLVEKRNKEAMHIIGDHVESLVESGRLELSFNKSSRV